MNDEHDQNDSSKNEEENVQPKPEETTDPIGPEGSAGEDEDPGSDAEPEGFETVDLGDEEGEPDEEMPDFSDMLPPTDVMTLSQLFISMLTNSAWQFMGLIPDPKTKKIEADLKQAGQAIDIIEFLHGKLKDDMDKEMASGIDDLLANLRINFVKKSAGGQ